ncbi:MAG TPA: hypothetical protein VM658_12230 [bacterium]|nr:hypothetical protein [bacterium]
MRKSIKAARLVGWMGAMFLGLVLGGLVMASSAPMVRMVPYDKMTATGQKPLVKKVYYNPSRGWVGSDVFLKEGDIVTVSAQGLVDPGVRLSRGPDGAGTDLLKEMTHNCTYMQLMGRVGDGPTFCLGSNATFEVIEGGHLSFHVNELDALRYDDLGHFDITVQWVSPKGGGAAAQGAVLTAVLDLSPINVPENDTLVLSSALRGLLAATGRYTIIDQNQVNQTVKRLRIAKADLANPQTAARVGNAMGATQVVTGQIGKIGSAYSVTLQRVNCKTGQVENTVVEVYDCPKEQLPARLATAAAKL